MGCGGSRMDALEPHYLESWTKDTESTWLAGSDTDVPLSSIHSLASERSSDTGFTSEKTCTPVPDIFEDSLPPPAQAYLKVCSSPSEASEEEEEEEEEEETEPLPTVQPSQDRRPPAGAPGQRGGVLQTEERTKWANNNRMSTQQVTITVPRAVPRGAGRSGAREKPLAAREAPRPADGARGRRGGRGAAAAAAVAR